jgi:hypothetical protein
VLELRIYISKMKTTLLKYFSLFFWGFINYTCLYAQSIEEFSFLGVLTSAERQAISYKIDIKIEGSKVTGVSTMDLDGPNLTTAKLVGTYNYKTKILYFSETKVITSKAPIDGDFCYISARTKMSSTQSKAKLTGTFWGLVDEKDSCVKGDLQMVSTAYVSKKMATVEKIIKKSGQKDSAVLAKVNNEEFKKSLNSQRITAKEGISLRVEQPKILIGIWDDGLIDNDIISIKLNGKVVLYNYTLTKDPKLIGIELNQGNNSVEIIAVNIGATPPNTAYIMLQDGSTKTVLSSDLLKGESANITIVK